MVYLDKLIISVSVEGALTRRSESRCLDSSSIVSQLLNQIGSYGNLRLSIRCLSSQTALIDHNCAAKWLSLNRLVVVDGCRSELLRRLLELADVLKASPLLPLHLVSLIKLSIEKLCVGATLAHVDVVLGGHFVLKLLFSPRSHRDVKLAFGSGEQAS